MSFLDTVSTMHNDITDPTAKEVTNEIHTHICIQFRNHNHSLTSIFDYSNSLCSRANRPEEHPNPKPESHHKIVIIVYVDCVIANIIIMHSSFGAPR